MKPGVRVAVELGKLAFTALIDRLLGRRSSGPTAAELRDALRVGGPTSEAHARAQREAAERWGEP